MSVMFWVLVFFFSSRRRHTRFDCDWSSDVCSSDLDDADARRELLERIEVIDNTPPNDHHVRSLALECRRPRSRRVWVRKTACLRDRKDRKSTRLNSSHSQISYAVFCLKKKKAMS